MTAKPRSFLRSLRTNMLVGALLIAPIVVTWWIIEFLLDLFTAEVVLHFPTHLKTGYWLLISKLAALLLVLLLLFVVGLLARNIFGRRLYTLGDTLLRRVPVVNMVYRFIRQIIEVFFAGPSNSFQEAVLVEYPRLGVWSMGFITATVPPSHRAVMAGGADSDLVCVFIPTTPNPTSGWFCIVPRSTVRVLPMSPGDAMKLVISGGAVFPGQEAVATGDNLLRKVDQWIAEEDSPPGSSAPRT